MITKFKIPGEPQGKARPRVTRYATYTPKKTLAYEKLVRGCYSGGKFIGPVEITIEAFYRVPSSDSKRKQKAKLDNSILPTKKPDWDNIGKIICDSLNGVAYKDDSQITTATVIKRYSATPEVIVTIRGDVEDETK